MTELRDARLRKAMDEAPDAALLPPARMREAIRTAAHAAVQPAWRRWWPRAGQGRTPWAAAFATVLLAGFIGLMWQGQEIPGAREEMAGTDRQSPVAVPAPAVVPEPAPAARATAPAPPPAAEAPPPARATVPAPTAKARVQERQRAARDERAAEAKQEQEQRRVEEPAAAARRAEVAQAPAAAPAPAAPSAPPPPPPAMADLARRAPESLAKSQSAPAAGAVAPQRAPAPAAAPSLRAAAPGVAWSQVRIEADGRSVVVPRAQAGRLASLVARVLQSEVEEGAASGPVSLRLELALGEQPAGVLEQVGERWRWVREAQPARVLRVDAGLGAALQQEAESLLRP